VAAGASCGLFVTFTGATAGSGTATLNISEDAGAAPQTFSLSGTAVRGSLRYRPIWPGGQSSQHFRAAVGTGRGANKPLNPGGIRPRRGQQGIRAARSVRE
jgi:hypothetical protein